MTISQYLLEKEKEYPFIYIIEITKNSKNYVDKHSQKVYNLDCQNVTSCVLYRAYWEE